MSEISPYQPPVSPDPPPPAAPGEPEPKSIMVFGILHLVFGGFSVIGGLWALVAVFLFEGLNSGVSMPAGGEGDAFASAQASFMAETRWVNVFSGVLSLVIAVLLVGAGLKLLKRRDSGRRWSNAYAWTAIVSTFVSLALTMAVVSPAMSRMTEEMVRGTGGGAGGADAALVGMQFGTMIGAVAGTLFALIYPILTLIFLNRGPVRRFLEAREAARA